MSSVKLLTLLATAATVICAACGPPAGVDRVGLADAPGTGGSSGEPADAAGAGSGGAGADSNPSAEGGPSGTGGASNDPGTGGGGTSTGGASGTGGDSGTSTGGASGTGGSGAAPDAGADDLINRLEPVLDLSYAAGAASTNLTAAGTLDWMHWALDTDPSAVNRKRNVTPLITSKKLGGTALGHYENRPSAVSWSDGTPTRTAANATDGLVVGDIADAGFEIKVAGVAARPRTLRLHVGGWQVAGKLIATIGGRSYSDTSFRNTTNPGDDRIYTIVFQPISDGESLTVRWTVTDVLQMYGNITLQAATLSE